MDISSRDVRKALGELGWLKFGSDDLDVAMERIVATTHALFRVDGAGLMLIDDETMLRNVASSNPHLAVLAHHPTGRGSAWPSALAFPRSYFPGFVGRAPAS